MKTQLLDQTLGDIFEEDGFDILENSNEIDSSIDEDNTACNSINISGIDLDSLVNSTRNEFSNLQHIKENKLEVNNIVNTDENHVIKQFEPKAVIKQNETAWGESLNNKINIPIKKPKSPTRSGAFKPNGILFKSQSISIRNPRKSLSRQNSEMSQGSNLSQNSGFSQEVLPDLETILTQKASKQAEVSAITSVVTAPLTSKAVLNEIDIGWLNRTTAEDGLLVNNNMKIRNSQAKPKTFGLGNIDLEKLKRLNSVKEDKIIDKSKTTNIIVDEISEYVPENKKDDDADEVVEESDNEEDSYRQSAKRRRVLPSNSVLSISAKKEPVTTDIRNEIPFHEDDKVKEKKSTEVAKKPKRKRNSVESSSNEDSEADSKPQRKSNSKNRKTAVKTLKKKTVRASRAKKEKVSSLKTCIPSAKHRRSTFSTETYR